MKETTIMMRQWSIALACSRLFGHGVPVAVDQRPLLPTTPGPADVGPVASGKQQTSLHGRFLQITGTSIVPLAATQVTANST